MGSGRCGAGVWRVPCGGGLGEKIGKVIRCPALPVSTMLPLCYRASFVKTVAPNRLRHRAESTPLSLYHYIFIEIHLYKYTA